jgi:hypothetical protein
MNAPRHLSFPKWAIWVALIGVFALPIMIAGLWYINVDQWGVGTTTNYGDLITPPVRLRIEPLQWITGPKVYGSRYFHGRWTLVYIGGANCNPDCRAAIYATRQIRLALGEEIRRVQRLYVVTHHPQKLAFLKVEDPDLTIALARGRAGRDFIRQFFKAAHARLGQRIYLVDPMGNLMMSYPAAVNPAGLLRDLKRLLSVSAIS